MCINVVKMVVRTTSTVLLLILSTFFVFIIAQFSNFPAYAIQSNVTTTCHNENCTTTICVNDEPCKTSNSSSANVTIFGNLPKNNTITNPQEVI
jgi:hypothetical protein